MDDHDTENHELFISGLKQFFHTNHVICPNQIYGFTQYLGVYKRYIVFKNNCTQCKDHYLNLFKLIVQSFEIYPLDLIDNIMKELVDMHCFDVVDSHVFTKLMINTKKSSYYTIVANHLFNIGLLDRFLNNTIDIFVQDNKLPYMLIHILKLHGKHIDSFIYQQIIYLCSERINSNTLSLLRICFNYYTHLFWSYWDIEEGEDDSFVGHLNGAIVFKLIDRLTYNELNYLFTNTSIYREFCFVIMATIHYKTINSMYSEYLQAKMKIRHVFNNYILKRRRNCL